MCFLKLWYAVCLSIFITMVGQLFWWAAGGGDCHALTWASDHACFGNKTIERAGEGRVMSSSTPDEIRPLELHKAIFWPFIKIVHCPFKHPKLYPIYILNSCILYLLQVLAEPEMCGIATFIWTFILILAKLSAENRLAFYHTTCWTQPEHHERTKDGAAQLLLEKKRNRKKNMMESSKFSTCSALSWTAASKIYLALLEQIGFPKLSLYAYYFTVA